MPVARMVLLVVLGLASKPPADVVTTGRALSSPGAASVARDPDAVVERPTQRSSATPGWGGSIRAMERNVRISLWREREQRIAGPLRPAPRPAGAGTTARAPSTTGATDLGLPDRIWFGPPMPNPTQGRISFRVDLPAVGRLRLTVLDVAGRVVHVIDETREPGRHVLTWDGQDRSGRSRPAGIYFARLFVDGTPVGTQRVIFLH